MCKQSNIINSEVKSKYKFIGINKWKNFILPKINLTLDILNNTYTYRELIIKYNLKHESQLKYIISTTFCGDHKIWLKKLKNYY